MLDPILPAGARLLERRKRKAISYDPPHAFRHITELGHPFHYFVGLACRSRLCSCCPSLPSCHYGSHGTVRSQSVEQVSTAWAPPPSESSAFPSFVFLFVRWVPRPSILLSSEYLGPSRHAIPISMHRSSVWSNFKILSRASLVL